MITIEEVYGKNYTFVDVRSPKEFTEDTIPGAVNIPLLLDDERAIVGTIYTKESKDKAMQVGMEYISKRLPDMFQEYNKLKQPIIIFCWRGGMRSGSITGLLKACGLNVQQLEGGYKTYRAYVRETLKNIELPKSVVVYGHTGAGKTEVICQLDNGLDLEGLAEHRGSILGDIGLEPVGQKKFEGRLLKRLEELKDKKFIVIECESRKIGKVEIPQKVFEKIKKPWKGIFLDKSVEERARISRDTYFPNANEKTINEIIAKLECIKKHLGGKKLDKVKELLRESKVTEAIKLLLVDYYDPHYINSFGKFDYTIKSNKEFFEVVKKLDP